MKLKSLLFASIIIFCAFPISSQILYQTNRLAQQIDSIAQANQIFKGIARYNKIEEGNLSSKTVFASLSNYELFKITDDLLIIDDYFFPLAKLLFFKIEATNIGSGKNKKIEKHFEFYFQGY